MWLSFVGPVHIKPWGIFVFTSAVQGSTATVGAQVVVQNQAAASQTVDVTMTLADDAGKVFSTLSQSATVAAGSESKLVFTHAVAEPRLWTVDQPVLYAATTELKVGGAIIETQTTPFGIRTFAFDAQQGFSLNGQAMKLHGLCMHHDLGALGAAINERAIERQLQILKDMGANAIRTSHNPPAPELLDACDRMGLVVMDEAFDCWRTGKNSYDYHLYFDQWAERDIRSMVQRDRNHPSVILWSIGNEIPEAKSADGPTLATSLIQWVRAEDPTRPVSDAESDIGNSQGVAALLDWVGLNYQVTTYTSEHSSHPDWKVYGSETSSAVRSRGIYHVPADQSVLADSDLQCSSYDNSVVPWGNSAEDSWRVDRDNAWLGGQFIWTGFDYLGEPTPYDWPAKSSYFGIVDTAGFPKDIYYFYLSQWSAKPTLHLLPHWNWPAGSTVTVFAYTNADSVDLTLNGRSLGTRSFAASGEMKLVWSVPFEAGTLQAVGKKADVVVATDQVVTAGAQAGVVLGSDRKEIVVGGSDLLFVEADVVDGSGNLVPDADTWMRFSVDGGGEIVAVDNGNPIDLDPYQAVERRAFSGKALAIVRAPKQPGDVTVRATALAGDKSVARGKTASADSIASGHPAADASDGSTLTEWCAADQETGHWWTVDLGSAVDLAGTQITWETPGPSYNYAIDASLDGTTWTTAANNRANSRTSQTQVDLFTAKARYLRVTVTGMPSGWSACIEDFRAFGSEAVLSSNALVVTAR